MGNYGEVMHYYRSRRRAAVVGAVGVLVGLASSLGSPIQSASAAGFAGAAAAAAKVGTVAIYAEASNATVNRVALDAGGTLVADYGSFALWRVPADAAEAMLAVGGTPSGDLDQLQLRGRLIDTLTDTEPEVGAGLRDAAPGDKALWLVQFAGPVKSEWIENLTALGLSIVVPVPSNGFVVHGKGTAIAGLQELGRADPTVSYVGPFRPAYRLAPELTGKQVARNADGTVDVTVQVVAGEQADVDAVLAAGVPLGAPDTVEAVGLTNVRVRVALGEIDALASLPSVVNVERYVQPTLNDEAQNQILAHNITQIGGIWEPTGPGYLAFLTGKSVSANQANHPVVAVVDDGVDNGTNAPIHADFYKSGSKTNPSRVVYNFDCTQSGSPKGSDGHGNINAGIVGGFNNKTGATFEDASGYNYGLGVDPHARLANVKIFGPSFNLANCAGTYTGIGEREVAAGAKISSNSWGAAQGGAYTASSQAYDAMTRDASAATPGLQSMFYVFSAGNSGPSLNTIGSPGTAKNVLTVGATENVRDQGVADDCGISDGDNADDMADFSSRGPTDDLRAKPDIVAPGTHVQGPASQDPSYNGSGVCGPIYYPAGQTLYTWSSGTSHSAPAVAGVAALAWEHYRRVVKPGVDPSPAMLKALLLNSPRYLDGLDTGGTLPGNGQGWGDADLSALYDAGRYAYDQGTSFTATGQQFTRYFHITSTTEPTRITLAFTDAPGSTVGNAYVNDLDLVVVAGGKYYRGNVFSGATSATGGSHDPRNNVEQVFLPAGITGAVAVRVIARNIMGNGVPGGPATDQDFALTAVNLTAAVTNPTVLPYLTGVSAADTGTGNNGNGAVEPGEMPRIAVGYGNMGAGTAPAGTVSIAKPTGSPIDIVNPSAATASLAAGAQASTGGLILRYQQSAACGGTFKVTARYVAGGNTASDVFTVQTAAGGPLKTVNSTDVPKAIPDNNPTGVSSTLSSPQAGRIGQVALGVTHTYDNDLSFTLTSPGGQTLALITRRGGSGDNFTGTVLDDAAATPISAGTAPFTGSFRPEQPLSTFTGNSVGTWALKVYDSASADLGTLTSWGIKLRSCAPAPLGVAVNNAPAINEGTGTGTTTMTFTVFRSGPTTNAITFPVSTQNGTAVAPGDYTAISGQTVTIGAGVAQKTVTVQVKKDATVEPNETLKLAIGTVPAGVQKVRGTGVGTIKNDD